MNLLFNLNVIVSTRGINTFSSCVKLLCRINFSCPLRIIFVDVWDNARANIPF